MNGPSHKSVSLDSFFKEKLEQMPVDLAGLDLQWQSVRQQVTQGPPQFPGTNAITICLVVAATVFFVWSVTNKKTITPEVMDIPVPQKNIQPEKTQQKPPDSTTHFNKPVTTKETEPSLPASPVISPGIKTRDSAKKITIAIRPDSSKKIAVPESRDSLFIFW